MGIYGKHAKILIEAQNKELSDSEKEQRKLYYDAKKFSDEHKFVEARKVINSMNDNKGENNYRIWAVAYMNRRKADANFDSKSEDQKKDIKKEESELIKAIKANIKEHGLDYAKILVKAVSACVIVVYPESKEITRIVEKAIDSAINVNMKSSKYKINKYKGEKETYCTFE